MGRPRKERVQETSKNTKKRRGKIVKTRKGAPVALSTQMALSWPQRPVASL